MAMDVVESNGRLIVTGANFRYTWDTRRGGELAVVEQQSTGNGGWWTRGGPRQVPSTWHRVNSTFAWKSLDTIPALSFATKRGAYYSGEWNIAYANADNKATLKVLKKGPDEIVFETSSRPMILENRRLVVPWVVKQVVRVFDSGVVILDLTAELPKDEVYELDWAQMGFNLDDSLYKEPHPERQARFQYGWAFGGETVFGQQGFRSVLQSLEHLPLDIDLTVEQRILTDDKPILFGSAAYDTTHVKGSAWNGFAECSLEDARSIVGTKEDFGSYIMRRPKSGMSPVPTWAGSMRPQPCFGLMWNLFDGKTAGLNEPLTYRNRMVFAFGQRKRSNAPGAPADDRNNLLGGRVYYARNAMPDAQQVKAMAAEGCDTLILGSAWQKDTPATEAIIQAAHAAGMRVGAAVDARNIKAMLADTTWFTKVFQKDRDGLLVTNAGFLSAQIPAGEFDASGAKAVFKPLDSGSTNAVGFALCMRALRTLVGSGGFLIAQEDPPGATLLSMAEFDLFYAPKPDAYQSGSPQDRCLKRYRAGAGFAPMVDSLSPKWMGLAAMHADTPIILWPAKDNQHLAWWQLCLKLPPGRSELSLLAAERRFTTSSDSVQGMLMQGADGKAVLLMTADKADSARVTFTAPVESVKAIDGSAAAVSGNAFDAGDFQPWQVKAFEVVFRKEASK